MTRPFRISPTEASRDVFCLSAEPCSYNPEEASVHSSSVSRRTICERLGHFVTRIAAPTRHTGSFIVLAPHSRLFVSLVMSSVVNFLCVPGFTRGQGSELRFEHLSVQNGLSHNTVNCVFQDKHGFMWFGTEDGLDKYDGYNVTIFRHRANDSLSLAWNCVGELHEDQFGYIWMLTERLELERLNQASGTFTHFRHDAANEGSLSESRVTTFFEDRAGTLWCGTLGGGLEELRHSEGMFIHHRCNPLDPRSLSNDTVNSICEDARGTLCVGTMNGLNTYDPLTHGFTRFVHDSRTPGSIGNDCVWIISPGKSGVLWLSVGREGLDRFDQATGTFAHYDFRVPLDMSWGSLPFIRTFHQDRHGDVWVGTAAGICRLDPGTGSVRSFRTGTPGSPLDELARKIHEDRAGRLWFATRGCGLMRFDPESERMSTYVHNQNDPGSLCDNSLWSICEDNAGALWVGTYRGGVDRIESARKPFMHYRQESHNPNSLNSGTVYSIVEDRTGDVWIGTADGLNRLDPVQGTIRHYTHDGKKSYTIADNIIRSLCEDHEGVLWVGIERGGLERFDPTTEKFIHHRNKPGDLRSLSDDNVMAVMQDRRDMLWVGTDDGVNTMDRAGESFTCFRLSQSNTGSPWSNSVWSLCEDSAGTMWIGTAGSRFGGTGLTGFDRTAGTITHFCNDPADPTSLSNNDVYAIMTSKAGDIWIGTAGGLNRYDRRRKAFSRFTVEDGMTNDYITGILEDDRGNLWMCTNQGLSRLDTRTGTFKNYDAGDGLQVIQFKGAHCRAKNGEMYFGGFNGMVRFHPDSIKDNPFIPPVVITAFKTFGKPVILDSAVADKSELHLTYKENVFSFEFAALSFTSPGKNQYAYKLEGFDREWVYCGTRRYATYTNLDAGRYVFRVKGSNNDGVWNEAGASIAVVITPPFWKAWWFSIVLWVAGACSIGGTVRFVEIQKMRRQIRLVEQQHALERERLRISSDLHDELASNLSSIAMLSKIAENGFVSGISGALRKEQLLRRIATLSQESVNSIRDIIWAIDSKRETLEGLLTRLSDMMVVACRAKNIDARVTLPVGDLLPSGNLPPEVRQHLWLLLKEAVNNAIKHSGCTELSLSAELCGGELKTVVKDNGSGFDRLKAVKGKGLGTMIMRAEKLGARLQQVSGPAAGTEIILFMRMQV